MDERYKGGSQQTQGQGQGQRQRPLRDLWGGDGEDGYSASADYFLNDPFERIYMESFISSNVPSSSVGDFYRDMDPSSDCDSDTHTAVSPTTWRVDYERRRRGKPLPPKSIDGDEAVAEEIRRLRDL